MNKETKINILKAIRSGQLPVNALHIEPGTYRTTDKPGIYKHGVNGYEIDFEGLKQLAKPLGLLVSASFVDYDEYPYLIIVSDIGFGWTEEKHYAEIRVINPETAENIVRLSE